MSAEKNPVLVDAGIRGARKRWGPPRVLRLDTLTADQRRLVLALVDATRGNEKGSPAVEKPGNPTEVRRVRDEQPPET